MKPTQSPSFRQILTYDTLLHMVIVYSFFLGFTSLGVLIYGLINKALNYAPRIGLGGLLLASLWLIVQLVWRIRFFQKIYENGETVRSTLTFVSTAGDAINVSGDYVFKKEIYGFSTAWRKTRRTKELAVGDQIWLVVNRDNPKNAYAQDLFTSESPDEIRQPFIPYVMEDMPQIFIPESAKVGDGTQPRKISWAYESHDDTFGDTKENPSESEIVKLIRDVYAHKANYGILEINKEQNLFMQIGFGGAPLEFCIGPDGPIYGVSAVPVEMAIKCFLSYNAGDEFWKTALPWKVHIKSIKDVKDRKQSL